MAAVLAARDCGVTALAFGATRPLGEDAGSCHPPWRDDPFASVRSGENHLVALRQAYGLPLEDRVETLVREHVQVAKRDWDVLHRGAVGPVGFEPTTNRL
jgi:hypothetical protein